MRQWLTSWRLHRGPTAQRLLTLARRVQLQSKKTNAETAGHAGTATLKQLNMVNIDMFKHPKYYKELRKLRNNLDQTISNSPESRVRDSVRSGPGPKPQAASVKPQASSSKRVKQQATSVKPQA